MAGGGGVGGVEGTDVECVCVCARAFVQCVDAGN